MALKIRRAFEKFNMQKTQAWQCEENMNNKSGSQRELNVK
jgi:hypothetical protein